jgi:molybdenum cofactor synthesis domain-containing protein
MTTTLDRIMIIRRGLEVNPIRAAILAIGREILRGRVQDTNSWVLTRRLAGIGIEVVRIASCDDDLDAIVREIRRSLEDGARLVLTTGGLGPTGDDLTLQALAAATNRSMVQHPEARRLVAERYAQLHAVGAVADSVLTPTREKMAWLPQGARPLPNAIGAAPGVWLEAGDASYIALPGVPAEMVEILEEEVLPLLAPRIPTAVFVERRIVTKARDESAVAPLLRELGRELPEVFFKSHPTRFGPDVRMEIFASTWATDPETAEARLARALASLRKALGEVTA